MRAHQEHGTGMGVGVDYSMEYMGVVSGMMMGLMAEMNDTGDKGQNTQWICGEHIENTDNMCLQYAQ